MNLAKIASIAADHCKDLNQLGRLLEAYDTAYRIEYHDSQPTEHNIKEIAKLIDPINHVGYRATSCRPEHSIADPGKVRGLIENHIHKLNSHFGVEDWIKEFLFIYPFKQGNIRLAWILRIWLKDQWNNPEPLPKYDLK